MSMIQPGYFCDEDKITRCYLGKMLEITDEMVDNTENEKVVESCRTNRTRIVCRT